MEYIPFLIALSLTCFAIYLANIAKEEMVGIFAAIVALVSFTTSLFLAPWFVLVLLVLALVLWRKLSLQ